MHAKFKLVVAIYMAFIVYELKAQDVHLSQFEASPLFLNPALGGQYNGDWQVGNSVREQWRSIDKPYQSNVFFFDRRFNYYSQEINAGIVFVHDQSGNAKLTSEKIYLSLAYPIKQGRSTISVGVQPGIVMRFYNDYLTFPSQYDNSIGYFNPDLSNNESDNYGNTNATFFDVNAGLYWTMNLPKIIPSIGVSFLHVNQPDESFNKTGSKMSIRQNIHANSTFLLRNDIYLKPSFYFSGQKKANEILIGSDVGKKIRDREKSIKEIFAGIYVRNGYNRNSDAFSPLIGIQYINWRIGMSYDITISELDAASDNRGAFEISVIYRAPSSSPKHTSIPCDRY